MKLSDVLGIAVAAGVVAGFVLKWPLWLDIVLLAVTAVELVLLFKKHE